MNAPAPAPLPPAPEGMVNVFVDGALLHVKKGSTVMKACEAAEKEIPHFCYHERLSIAGNCRMCLVEVEGAPKPVASCHWPVSEGMRIKTDSQITRTARKGTMELLLANHPLDCPICDQGGECTLQDLALGYGSDRAHYHEAKRAVDDKDIGSKIKTVMTRCIHCTRCVRFATEIAGVEEFGATGRGENMQIGTYVEKALVSELAGNMIDLCPVGALTSAPYAFRARPWELTHTESIDILEPCHAAIRVDSRAGEVMRVIPRENAAINEEWIADTSRFAYDALTCNRLGTPSVKKGKITADTGWKDALETIRTHAATPKAAMLVGPLMAESDLAAAASLMQVLGSPTIAALPDHLPANLPASATPNLVELEKAKAILLIGTNPREEAPLLNLRLRKASLKNKAQIFNLGTPADLTYPAEQLGNAPATLTKLPKPTQDALKGEGSHILIGYGALTRKDAPAMLEAAQALAKKTGAKLSILHPTTGYLSALHLGIHTAESSKILAQAQKGILTHLFIYGDPTSLTSAMLAKVAPTTQIIYLGTHKTPLATAATICLPTAAYTEKSATYRNVEGTLQTTQQATLPPHNAREDKDIFAKLAEILTSAPLPAFTPTPQAAPKKSATEVNTKAPLTPYLTAPLYLANPFLQQSPTMHKIVQDTEGQGA